jgi:ribose/xylose/arabinose/galactoside ABC-type transport system permease subunit
VLLVLSVGMTFVIITSGIDLSVSMMLIFAGVFATNLSSAEGPATGLRNANKLGQVELVGFDASPNHANPRRGQHNRRH